MLPNPRVPREVASRLRLEGGCWVWTGTLNDGYGYVRIGRRMHRVHRLVYEAVVGPIPAGLVLDHLCRNKACADPAHLEVVTQRANRGRDRVTHCYRGHPYDAANTYVSPAGRRYCRECKRINRRRSSP